MKLLQKAKILELKIRVKRENKKKIKTQSYRAFLQNPPRPLPPLKSLKKIRKIFIILAVLILSIPSIQILIAYDSVYYVPETYDVQTDKGEKLNREHELDEYTWGFIRSIPVIMGVVFFILSGFAMAVDWTIYRRWKKYTIINWDVQR